ncbi:MAG: DUF116 domain-containing protein [Candidatus Thorarchaeota archaeon]
MAIEIAFHTTESLQCFYCKRCGSCSISKILQVAESYNIQAHIVCRSTEIIDAQWFRKLLLK